VAVEFRPERILEVLVEHGVDYVMIGGLAAAIHGSDLVTGDIDITPSTDDGNLTRLSRALDELDARIRSVDAPDGLPFAHDAASLARATVWNLVTNAGDLDLAMMPSGTRGYDDLRRAAIAIDILGVPTRVAALADVIRSKEAAGRDKDRAALPMLRRLQEEIDRRARR
jgi:hypothetical protein